MPRLGYVQTDLLPLLLPALLLLSFPSCCLQLAEELRDREALERDVRSQQTVVQQMQIDRRIAEKRSRSQQQHQHLESMKHFGDGESMCLPHSTHTWQLSRLCDTC